MKILIFLLYLPALWASQESPSKYVDLQFPGGRVFRGANVPFGMAMPGPYGPGFSFTFLSGAEMPSVYSNDLLIFPTTKTPVWDKKIASSQNVGEPGFLESVLADGTIAQFTTTLRTAMAHFSFPITQTKQASILFYTDQGSGTIKAGNSQEISGWISRKAYLIFRERKIFFFIKIDRPFKQFVSVRDGAYVTFDTDPNPVVQVKVGLSFVSIDNARLNLEAENPNWNFDAIRVQAKNTWDQMLSLIEVNGGTEAQKRFFYTSFYHSLFHPNVFSDVNGEYLGFDGKVHLADGYTHYANYSGWDIYRSWVQLVAWLLPRQTSDMMQSLVNDARQCGGVMPRWPVGTIETGVMEGGSATPIVASAYAFGAKFFDAPGAFQAIDLAESKPGTSCQWVTERPQLREYLYLGYVPVGRDRIGRQSAAITLEYATGDFAAARFAHALGNEAKYHYYLHLSQNWKSLFNPVKGYIQPKTTDGNWMERFYPQYGDMEGFTEGNAIQYTWMVPHNLRALFDKMGGNAQAISRLNSFFTKLNDGEKSPYSWIGNEPGFIVPWEYNWAGAPWRTQNVVRRLITEVLMHEVPGDDDLGAMSSWGVWAALGLYPAIPGVGGFTIGSPLFPEVKIHLPDCSVLHITAPEASEKNAYIQALSVNGKAYTKTWLPLEALSGGELEFSLGDTPNIQWGSDSSDAPPSFED